MHSLAAMAASILATQLSHDPCGRSAVGQTLIQSSNGSWNELACRTCIVHAHNGQCCRPIQVTRQVMQMPSACTHRRPCCLLLKLSTPQTQSYACAYHILYLYAPVEHLAMMVICFLPTARLTQNLQLLGCPLFGILQIKAA